jgi:hypothetical protein
VSTTGTDVKAAFADVAKVLLPTAVAGPGLPSFLIFIAAVLTSMLALLVWLELALREAAVYLALVFMPLALAAAVWPRTVHWAQRLAGWLGALILAKLTIATAFALAGSMLAHARPGSGGLSALLAGCAVLILAAVSPWVLLRLIPFTASGEGLHRPQFSGAARPGVAAAMLIARQGAGGVKAKGPAPTMSRGAATWAPAPARSTERSGQ